MAPETPSETRTRQPAAAKEDVEILAGEPFPDIKVAYVHVRSVINNCIQWRIGQA